MPKTDPNKVTWKRSLSINGSYNSAAYVQGPIPGAAGTATGLEGRSLGLSGKQQTVQINGMILRASPTEAITLTGSYGYADYEPAGKVVDNWNGEFTYTHILSPKTYVLARSTYKVDHIALIDHSFEQVAGYGLRPGGCYGQRYVKGDVAVIATGPGTLASGKGVLGTNEIESDLSFCHGDSGGPAIGPDGAIVGLVERGGDCEANEGHVYTTTAAFGALATSAYAAANAFGK